MIELGRIYNEECLETMKRMEDKSVDLIVTDPPYGMNKFDGDGKDFLVLVGPRLREAWRLLVDGGSLFVFTSTAEVLNVGNAVAQPLQRMFWMYKPADCTYPYQGWLLTSEAILWFVKGERPVLQERKPFKHDCYVHTRVGKEGVEGHPTVKPLVVIKDFVARCPVEGIVYDPFMGSGTTAIAAMSTGRRWIGSEINPEYCRIAEKRIEAVQAQGNLFA